MRDHSSKSGHSKSQRSTGGHMVAEEQSEKTAGTEPQRSLKGDFARIFGRTRTGTIVNQDGREPRSNASSAPKMTPRLRT